LRWLFM